ncbi:MAG: FAD-binding protein, partial [Paramuribaculum sp.]|nr:FAD-binding protein [Paramuribaculum sp.]
MITRLQDYNLRAANTFRLDARCEEWIEYTSADDLPAIRGMIGNRRRMSVGQGANLLFTDDFSGVVLHSKILDIEISRYGTDELLARVGAGVSMDAFIAQCASQSVWGLENLSGIPGHAGASAVQNVGAYGVEAGDRI